jgi:hypothetical protein
VLGQAVFKSGCGLLSEQNDLSPSEKSEDNSGNRGKISEEFNLHAVSLSQSSNEP